MKDFSNVTTQNLGQNGYCKFPNGLMIQWGYIAAGEQYKTIQLPLSFIDTGYSIAIGMFANSAYLEATTIVEKKASYFKTCSKAVSGVNVGPSGESICWFAIGRWK